MAECSCHPDWRAIPKERRIVLEEPGSRIQTPGKILIDRSKVHVYDRDCALHGYREIVADE